MKYAVLGLLLVSLCIGCRPAYFASDIRLKRKVEESEIIGRWRLRQESVERAKVEGKRDDFVPAAGERYIVEVRSDHTCRFSSLTQVPLRYGDYEGTWQLDFEKGGRRPNQLVFSLKRGAGYTFALEFTEEEGRLVLWEYLGDPDDWLFLKYDKEPNQ